MLRSGLTLAIKLIQTLLSTDGYIHSVIHLQHWNLAKCTRLHKTGQLHVLIPYEFDITTTTLILR